MLSTYLLLTPVASFIFAITIAASIYMFSHEHLFGKYMLHPFGIYRDKKRWYTIITSGLIHKDYMHLIFNMLTFYYFGFALERMFVSISGEIGHLYFLLLYLISLILSDLPTIMQHKNNVGYYSLGASGAICAVLFSFILFDPNTTLYLMMIVPLPAYLFALLFLGYCVWASKKGHQGINHDAHLFGALSGLLLTIIAYPWVIRHFVDQF